MGGAPDLMQAVADSIERARAARQGASAACPECKNQFGGKMPGHVYSSNWEWVPCQTCNGTGLSEAPR